MSILTDRKILFGMGIGIILATVIMIGTKINTNLSKSEIEKRAAGYGMKYPEEFRVIPKKGNK